MTGVSGEVNVQSEKIHRIFEALEELTAQYATFKTLSTASKNLSQYTDEYHTRFSYYNNLRRITLGYVIGLDTNFVTNESMRKAVEKVYLQNTEYWLAYATTAVMLWASDEKEAAERAVGKAMFMNPSKAALFFMLINLRFDRIKPAQEWFVTYMDRASARQSGRRIPVSHAGLSRRRLRIGHRIPAGGGGKPQDVAGAGGGYDGGLCQAVYRQAKSFCRRLPA